MAVVILLVTAIVIVDSFTRIGVLRASTNENEPVISRALNIINSFKEDKKPAIGKPATETKILENLDTLKTNVISHKIAVKDTNLKIAPFPIGGESRIHLIKDGTIEYGFIGKIREVKGIDSRRIDSISSVTCIDGGGVMGNFTIENITVAYNSFISTPGLNTVYFHGYEYSKEILFFLRNKLSNPRILEAMRKNAGAHFQIGVSLNKLGQIMRSFLSTSSDSHEIDDEFVHIFSSLPATCIIQQNNNTIRGDVIYLFAITVSNDTTIKSKTGKDFDHYDSIRWSRGSEFNRSVYKIALAFAIFLEKHWQIPNKLKNDTSNNVILLKVLFDENGKAQRIIKGEPWDYLKYRFNNNFTIIDDPQIIEELSRVAASTPFDFLKQYQDGLNIKCAEMSFCVVIKMNKIRVNEYSWGFAKPK